jgi:hypothetical protein
MRKVTFQNTLILKPVWHHLKWVITCLVNIKTIHYFCMKLHLYRNDTLDGGTTVLWRVDQKSWDCTSYFCTEQAITPFKTWSQLHQLRMTTVDKFDISTKTKKTNSVAWVCERTCRLNDSCLSAKLLPTFVDRRCHVVSVTDPYGRNLGFRDRSRYFFLSSSSSIVLMWLSGPHSRPTTSQKIC